MRRWMGSVVLIGAVLAPGGCCGSHAGLGPPSPNARAPLYVSPGATAEGSAGVYDRVEVLVAYHKSARQREVLRGMIRERDGAKARGDMVRVAELEHEGEAMQHRAHRQLAGKEPLTNVAEALGEALPELARRAGVVRIVERGAEARGVKTVEVTGEIVALLPE